MEKAGGGDGDFFRFLPLLTLVPSDEYISQPLVAPWSVCRVGDC